MVFVRTCDDILLNADHISAMEVIPAPNAKYYKYSVMAYIDSKKDSFAVILNSYTSKKEADKALDSCIVYLETNRSFSFNGEE